MSLLNIPQWFQHHLHQFKWHSEIRLHFCGNIPPEEFCIRLPTTTTLDYGCFPILFHVKCTRKPHKWLEGSDVDNKLKKIAFCWPYERGQVISRFWLLEFFKLNKITTSHHTNATKLLSAILFKIMVSKVNFDLLLQWISSEYNYKWHLRTSLYFNMWKKQLKMNVYNFTYYTCKWQQKVQYKLFWRDLLLITAMLIFCLQKVDRPIKIINNLHVEAVLQHQQELLQSG